MRYLNSDRASVRLRASLAAVAGSPSAGGEDTATATSGLSWCAALSDGAW